MGEGKMKKNSTKKNVLIYPWIIYNSFLKDLELLSQIGKNNIEFHKGIVGITCKNEFQSNLLFKKFGKPMEIKRM